MIAVDTSSFIGYLAGDDGSDVALVESALADQTVVLPPAVLAELLSAPRLESEVAQVFCDLPMLDLHGGYWERVGAVRATILRAGKRARLADALIAQSCVDHDVPLVTRDSDFRHFVAFGLSLLS
jgi:predicted nucleic acid-binding protein